VVVIVDNCMIWSQLGSQTPKAVMLWPKSQFIAFFKALLQALMLLNGFYQPQVLLCILYVFYLDFVVPVLFFHKI